MKHGTIYLHRNIHNGKIYVGKTTQTPERRWRKTNKNFVGYRNCSAFQNALFKYGWDAFETVVLCSVPDITNIKAMEEYFIKYYNSAVPNGYNLKLIDNGLDFHSQETKEKISRLKLGIKTGKPAWNSRKIITVDNEQYLECSRCKSLKAIKQFHKIRNEEQFDNYCKQCKREYRRRYKYEKKSLDEVKQSYKLRGEKSSLVLREKYENNPELKEAISKANSKAIKSVHNETGEVVIYESAIKAKEAGHNNTNIWKALNWGTNYKGCKWYYVTEE